MHEYFGYIPHPASFDNNPRDLMALGTLFNIPASDIIMTNIGVVDGNNFEAVYEDESGNYHIDELSFVIWIE